MTRAPPAVQVRPSGCCAEHSATWVMVNAEGVIIDRFMTEAAARAALAEEGGDDDSDNRSP